jgi:hypothetical protein
VADRTRGATKSPRARGQANRAIADRFEQLAHEQIDRAIAWLEDRASDG